MILVRSPSIAPVFHSVQPHTLFTGILQTFTRDDCGIQVSPRLFASLHSMAEIIWKSVSSSGGWERMMNGCLVLRHHSDFYKGHNGWTAVNLCVFMSPTLLSNKITHHVENMCHGGGAEFHLIH